MLRSQATLCVMATGWQGAAGSRANKCNTGSTLVMPPRMGVVTALASKASRSHVVWAAPPTCFQLRPSNHGTGCSFALPASYASLLHYS